MATNPVDDIVGKPLVAPWNEVVAIVGSQNNREGRQPFADVRDNPTILPSLQRLMPRVRSIGALSRRMARALRWVGPKRLSKTRGWPKCRDDGGNMVASGFMGEFLGTMILILFGNGCVANVVLTESKGNGSGWIVIATGWAVAVIAGVAVALAAGSHGHINPAVTLAFAVASHSWADVPAYLAGQFLGAFVGAALVWLTYLRHWRVTEDVGLKLACYSTAPAIRDPIANVITECIGAFTLVFIVIAIFAKSVGTTGALGPIMVGFLVWGIGLSLGGPTGYAINPARDLGPRLAHAVLPIAGKGGSDWSYAWVPVFGPIVGALAAILVAKMSGLA